MRKKYDFNTYVGKTIGLLTIEVLFKVGIRHMFTVLCSCGNHFDTRAENIPTKRTKSCGCKRYDFVSAANKLPDNRGLLNVFFKNYRYGAVNRDIPFSISQKIFEKIISQNCTYCGSVPRPYRIRKEKKGQRRDRILICNGIDRVDNNLGYTRDNCVACCTTCNAAKSTLTHEEFLSWIQSVVHHNSLRFETSSVDQETSLPSRTSPLPYRSRF